LKGHPHLICYAVKANSNLAVLNILARLGSGFDIVSEGELKRVLAAGGEASKIVFSGVGKSVREMEVGLEAGIRCFNVESAAELERLATVAAAHGATANVSLRINPDVDAQTHPYISTGLKENKFGIGMSDAMVTYRRAAELSSIDVHGIDCHIGSQLTKLEPYKDAVALLINMVDELANEGIHLSHPAGVLLTRVEYLKSNENRHFAVVDAAMNDLIRPALYSAWQAIESVETLPRETKTYDVVGPICESSDFLGKQRELAIQENDLLCVRSAGAYSYVMSSNYNTRPVYQDARPG